MNYDTLDIRSVWACPKWQHGGAGGLGDEVLEEDNF